MHNILKMKFFEKEKPKEAKKKNSLSKNQTSDS